MKKIFAIVFITTMLFSFTLPINALYGYVDTDDHGHVYLSGIKDWYKDAYEFVNKEAIMTDIYVKVDNRDGYMVYYSDFCGERNISRSEVVSIFHRYDGNTETMAPHHHFGSYNPPYANSTCPTFVDVPDGQWYTPAAQWAYENGIVNGVGGAYFAPDRTITREEFAAMLYRYTEYLEVDTSARVDYSAFADSDSVSSWANDAMSWAVAEGLINGKPGKLLAPQDTITRAEVATVIYRFNNEVKAHRDIWDGKTP